ncbi:MAG: FHA domain-containing protein [Spirochaetales bacterium]|nr:FHA domain-containing protein [Spirochaetales bacterium]
MAKKDIFKDETFTYHPDDDFVVIKDAVINARKLVPMLEAHGKFKQLSNKAISLGREKNNGVIIADPSVSKLHAIIVFRDGKAYIRDSKSKNGTYLNRKKIPESKEIELHNKDEIMIGKTKITFLC